MAKVNEWGWTRAQWVLFAKLFAAVAAWFLLLQPASMYAAKFVASRLAEDSAEYDFYMLAFFILFGGVGLYGLRFWVKHGAPKAEE